MTGTAIEAISKIESSVLYLNEYKKILHALVQGGKLNESKGEAYKSFVDIANKIGEVGKELSTLSHEMLMR